MRVTLYAHVLLLTLLAGIVLPAQSLNAELQRITQQATVTGDLRAAIEGYKRIVDRAGSNREVAVQALMRMAECYQKLGDAEARAVYARIVREFPDRQDATAIASARLATTAPFANVRGDRPVWTGSTVESSGRVSPDGRFITYVDWNDGRLMIRDLVANESRALTAPLPDFSQFPESSAVSKNGKHIVYAWSTPKEGEVRLAELKDNGLLEPRRLTSGYLASFDWSPDGRWIAGRRRQGDKAEIVVISVADGSMRPIAATPWTRVGRDRTSIFFSPDGRHVAYDGPADDPAQRRDVFVIAIDGTGNTPVALHSADDTLMGWSPDGRRILFSSDRTGSVGLWAQPFSDGRPIGAAELLRVNVGPGMPMGMSASGTLYVYRSVNTRDVAVGAIDIEKGTLVGAPLGFQQDFLQGARNPTWSPDGRFLAYPITCNNGCAAIRNVATGQVRKVGAALSESRAVSWSPDGRLLLMKSRDAKGRDGIFQIDVQSGEAAPLLFSDGLAAVTQWSRDGAKIYFNRDGVFMERDLASGTERIISSETGERAAALSPDGRYLAVARADRSAKSATILLIPVAGGRSRELLRTTGSEALFRPGADTWTPDGKALLVQKYTGARWELWLYPITGETPRRFGIDPRLWRPEESAAPGTVLQGDGGISLSRDGRRIALVTGLTTAEVWALENFLPTTTAR